MSLKRKWTVALSAIALLLLAATCSTASAATIPLTFGAGSNFSTDVAVNGSLTIGATGSFNISTPGIGSILGLSLSGNLNIPNQSFPIGVSPNPTHISVTPSGTATLTLNGPPTTLPTILTAADMSNLNVTLLSSAALNLTPNPINVTGTTSFDLGIFGNLNIGTTIQASPHAALSNLGFQQTSGDFLPGDGTAAGAPFDGTATYFPAGAPGNITATLSAGVNNAKAIFDLSLFGTQTVNFGDLLDINQAVNQALALLGKGILHDLAPGTPPGRPMQAEINDSGLLALFPLSGNLTTGGSVPFDIVHQNVGSLLGADFFLDAHGTANFTIAANFAAANAAYTLKSQVVNGVVIPEPSSVCLALLGALALVPMIRRRIRR